MNAIEHRLENAKAAEEWLRGMKVDPSPLGIRACVLLALWEQGFHHIAHARHVRWNETGCIIAHVHGSVSTFDNSQLSRLVFLAHDECLRVELKGPESCDPDAEPELADEERPHGLRLLITARERIGDLWDKHPTLEEALAKWREQFSAEIAYTGSEVAA